MTDLETGFEIIISPMQQEHIMAAVEIHIKSFPGFFSTILGSKYVSIVYSELIKLPDRVAFVAQDKDQELMGFIIGMTDQSNFYSQMLKKHWLKIALASLQAVIRKPQLISRLLRALLYPRESRKASANALLLSIAVLPTYNGKGIGQRLLQAFLNEMEQMEIPSVCLTTDAKHNERTNHFYQESGFKIIRTYLTAEGRLLNEYLIKLGNGSKYL